MRSATRPTPSSKFQDVKQQRPRHEDQQTGQDDPDDHAANSCHQRPRVPDLSTAAAGEQQWGESRN